jgi:hypothetical protein
MQGNDIGGEIVPRLVIVFEGLLGVLPDKRAEAKAYSFARLHRWRKVINTFEINEEMAKRIWDITWRYKHEVDVVTFLGEQYAKPLEKRLDQEDLPIRHVWADDPVHLSRRLATMPHVAAVYDAEPSRRFTYGSKGRWINPDAPDLLGRF